MSTRKPRQARAKVTVDTIIEAGFIAVALHGPSGTTTRHIAEIAGVSVGSLYEYFKNKEEIYDAMNGTVAKLAMRQPFVLFKGLTFQKLCL
ncbi:TetR/AcrR family transcriptional regulator, partial [Acinetobacter baumannii]